MKFSSDSPIGVCQRFAVWDGVVVLVVVVQPLDLEFGPCLEEEAPESVVLLVRICVVFIIIYRDLVGRGGRHQLHTELVGK